MIGNLIVRQEVESACKQKYEFDLSKDSTLNDIQRIGDNLYQNEKNSHFSCDFIHENSADWQSHLERISDFLIFGENVWWEKNEFGFEFLILIRYLKIVIFTPKSTISGLPVFLLS